jgi:hypothetical protein
MSTPESDNDVMALQLPKETEAGKDFTPDGGPASSDQATGDYRGVTSRKGEAFDPSIHESPPTETSAGYWRKKRGRGAAAFGTGTSSRATPVGDEPNAAYLKEAERLAGLYANSLSWLFGPEARPGKKSDYGMITEAWFQYMVENGAIKVSPVPALILSHVTYTTEVLQRPGPAERAKAYLIRIYLATPWGKRALRKHQEAQQDAATAKPDKGPTYQQ